MNILIKHTPEYIDNIIFSNSLVRRYSLTNDNFFTYTMNLNQPNFCLTKELEVIICYFLNRSGNESLVIALEINLGTPSIPRVNKGYVGFILQKVILHLIQYPLCQIKICLYGGEYSTLVDAEDFIFAQEDLLKCFEQRLLIETVQRPMSDDDFKTIFGLLPLSIYNQLI